MEFPCPYCTEVLLSHSAKANHIRWKHKNPGYSPDGLEKIRENARAIHGPKTTVVETRICHCKTSFEVTFSPERKAYVKKFCSRKCANSRNHSEETKEKIKTSVAIWAENNPDTFAKWRNGSTRFSSKAERALAEKLAMLGFVRNRVVRTDTLSFAVDMMSADGRVWIESDGEWHFRQVHEGHDFEKTQLRDKTQEEEALKQNILLIRIDNQKHSLLKQLEFVWDTIGFWDGRGIVRKFY